MEKIKKGDVMFALIEPDECLEDQSYWKKRVEALNQAESLLDSADDGPISSTNSDHLFVVEVQVKKITKVTMAGLTEKAVESLSVEDDC